MSWLVMLSRTIGAGTRGALARSVAVRHALALFTIVLATARAGDAVADPLFAAPFLSFDTALGPLSVAMADVNGDGRMDLVTANAGEGTGASPAYGNTVSVLLGNGDGTFGARTDFIAGSVPVWVAIADLNGDGRPDIVTANAGAPPAYANTVSVLLGNGDGTFGPNTDFVTGSVPVWVAIADLNGDGRPDLVTANAGTVQSPGNTVSVLLGNGDGTFGARTDFVTGSPPRSVAVGDLNGDGRADLAVAASNGISVLLGNGDGTFGERTDFSTGREFVAIGDLDGDGHPDLVFADAGSIQLAVLPGNGDGTFGAIALVSIGYDAPSSVAIGDFNGDGRPDLAVTASDFGGPWGPTMYFLDVLLGHGDGSFGPVTRFITSPVPTALAIGDVNGDGHADIVSANGGARDDGKSGSTVSVLPGNGDGTFGSGGGVSTLYPITSVAIGDLDRDGTPDLVTAHDGVVGMYRNTVSVLLGDGLGGFIQAQTFDPWPGALSVTLADFNGDGWLDLAVANGSPYTPSNTVTVRLGVGGGRFGASADFATGSYPWCVAAGDLDHDGHVDLVVANYGSNTVSVLRGYGNGSFGAMTDFGTGIRPQAIAIADLDGDGNPDLVVANYGSNTISVLPGNGAGGFGARNDYPTGSHPRSVAIGDVNGDGIPDLVVANGGSNTVSVLPGMGNGTFWAKTDFAVGNNPGVVAIADLDGDGWPDLAVANTGSNTISVLPGSSFALFSPRRDYGAGYGPCAAVIADMNGDGKPDLVVGDGADGMIVVLTNAAPRPPLLLVSWGSEGTGDGQFHGPFGVAADHDGHVFVLDAGNSRVQKFTSDGAWIRSWGIHGLLAMFEQMSIATNADGDVYVMADSCRIQKFTGDGTYRTEWGGYGEGNGQFVWPGGIATDDSGHVYAADAGRGDVQVFTGDGVFLRKWSVRDGGAGGWPTAIAMDPRGQVYVLDDGVKAVLEFTRDGVLLARLTNADLDYGTLTGVAADADGNVYVANGGACIHKFASDGHYIGRLGAVGTPALPRWGPWALATDSRNNLYVTDTWNNRVLKFGVGSLAAVKPGELQPGLALAAPYPNPFAGRVNLRFRTPVAGSAAVEIYDVLGRRLERWQWSILPPGEHEIAWQGRDRDGRPLRPGVLFCRLNAGGRTLTRKLVHL